MLDGTESWVPDELAFAGRENRDPTHAKRYDQIEDSGAANEVAMLQDWGMGANAKVVDMGTGTGQFAVAASPVVAHVTAVDISPVMLDELKAKLASLGLANVSCELAGFLTYRHSLEPADLVYSRYALHHLPEFWQAVALSRMASFLRPGGLLRLSDVVYGFAPDETAQRLQSWIDTYAPAAPGDQPSWARADLEEHIRDEHSTFTWLLEPMLERAGFTIEEAVYSEDQVFARYLCVRR
ncbi:MAG: methyltransferase domain-containing protein [Actinobacteria bacterium]|nr:methyltransferase domain-containing protein [Actinomycetota bacterium]